FPLHNSYPTAASRRQSAVAFLRAHAHQVNPITLDIGANDLLNLISSCAFNPTCIVNGFASATATMSANVDHILTALHNAAPGAEMIMMNVPDPFEFAAPASLQLFAAYNRAL